MISLKGIDFAVFCEGFEPLRPLTPDASEREWWEILCILTLTYHLRIKHQSDPDKEHEEIAQMCLDWGVAYGSFESLVDNKYPTDTWWACVVSRAREAQDSGPLGWTLQEDEVEDWGTIGNVALGFSDLRQHLQEATGSEPPHVPDLMALYESQAELQEQGVGVAAVREEHLPRFRRSMKIFWSAIARRVEAIAAIPADTALNRPYLQMFGDVAAMHAWEKEQALMLREALGQGSADE